MEKLVNQSKLIYYSNMFDDKDTIVEMKLGKIYEVETYAGETGDTVCKFTSELESITIDDDWINKEDYPDGFIIELIFKNGVTIYEPQYDHNAVNICESDMEVDNIKGDNMTEEEQEILDKNAKKDLMEKDEEQINKGQVNKIQWKCSTCNYQLEGITTPPEMCPGCGQTCSFIDATCYIPECEVPEGRDRRI